MALIREGEANRGTGGKMPRFSSPFPLFTQERFDGLPLPLYMNANIEARYKSKAQQARVESEAWIAQNGFCPGCGDILTQTPNNTRGAGFSMPRVRCSLRAKEYWPKVWEHSARWCLRSDGRCDSRRSRPQSFPPWIFASIRRHHFGIAS